mgnify:CR=1 FL=1
MITLIIFLSAFIPKQLHTLYGFIFALILYILTEEYLRKIEKAVLKCLTEKP